LGFQTSVHIAIED
jgi:hypothetical protein